MFWEYFLWLFPIAVHYHPPLCPIHCLFCLCRYFFKSRMNLSLEIAVVFCLWVSLAYVLTWILWNGRKAKLIIFFQFLTCILVQCHHAGLMPPILKASIKRNRTTILYLVLKFPNNL